MRLLASTLAALALCASSALANTESFSLAFSKDGSGYDLYSSKGVKVEGFHLPGGPDNNPLELSLPNGRLFCIQAACGLLKSDGANIIPLPAGKSLLELATIGSEAFGLFQKDFDDRSAPIPDPSEPVFFVCPITAGGPCEDVAPDAIPYRLHESEGRPAYDAARTEADLAALLSFDLERVSKNPLVEARDNKAGRIDWSVVYYLDALASLASDAPELPPSFSPAIKDAKRRLKAGVQRLAVQDPAQLLTSTRYSLGNTPILSILSFGRLARAIKRSEPVVGADTVLGLLGKLCDELVDPSRTIERVSTDHDRPELRFRKGVPFWADGANAAWNFQSAYASGLAALGELRADTPAARMISLFIAEEDLTSLPQKWHYSGGDLRDGWTKEQNVSTNTPDWKGDKGNIAHASYRTMDAIAIVAAYRAGAVDVPGTLLDHLRALVEQGYLLPSASEELFLIGKKPIIPRHIARLHARSILPHQLQSQIWAIGALTK